MSSLATRYSDWLAALGAGCDGLVHPAVCESTRGQQRRLLSVLLVGPFAVAAWAAQVLPAHFGMSVILACICIVLAGGWVGAVSLSSTGRAAVLGPFTLIGASVITGLLLAAAGGVASPLALLLLALVVEPLWVRRDATSLQAGILAVILALGVQTTVGAVAVVQPTAATAWHWLLPLAYLGSIAARVRMFSDSQVPLQSGKEAVALEDIIDAAIFKMARNGDVLDAGGRARALFALQPELLLGTGLFDRIHVADRVAYLNGLADIREGVATRHLDLRIRLPRAAGEQQADNFRHFGVELASCGDQQVVAIVRADTGAAALREELARTVDAADTSDVAKNRFLATVSHELRTPLNAIIGFSEMLLHEIFGGFAEPRQKEYVGLIRESGHHLLAVVNSILDVSKIESGAYAIQPEYFRFKDAVEMCRSMMNLQAQAKRIAITTDVAPGVAEIKADRRAISQILINLVSNAVKFTPEGGKVAVGAKRLGSRLHFWVGDTGIGISETDLASLGRPFVQVRNDYTRQFEGTGLGLSLVKGLVALHQGTMSIESAPGEGTTVRISLPVAGPANGNEDEGSVTPLATIRNNGETVDGTLRKTA